MDRSETSVRGGDPSGTRKGFLGILHRVGAGSRAERSRNEVEPSMRMSHLFGRTLREAPGDVELPSHRLMLRAALIRPLGAGIYSLLPLGWRVVRKIEQIIREERDALGGQEMLMPHDHPADISLESRRYQAVR